MVLLWGFCVLADGAGLPEGFVSMTDIEASIIVEARYYGSHNFVGTRIDGYEANKCILTKKAAQALKRVQKDILPLGLSLKVYDCYRPQTAVDHFGRWANDLRDNKMKDEFYPGVDKKDLFKDGYIDVKSGHSRGSTVDLTLVEIPQTRQEIFNIGQTLKDCRLPRAERYGDNSIDMGSGYDCFDPLSNTTNGKVGREALRNRLLLKAVMERRGFINYPQEWWHFTLKNEPYQNKYFNFPVQ